MAAAPTPATTAGQARDYDVEEAGNGADDGLEDRGDAVDNRHQAGTDGAEYGLDLWFLVSKRAASLSRDMDSRMIRRLPF
jgi:hypothetical protein